MWASQDCTGSALGFDGACMKPDSPPEVITKAQRKAKCNRWQDAYALQVKQAGLPKLTEEYEAIPGRKFRWDFAYPECLILIEIVPDE